MINGRKVEMGGQDWTVPPLTAAQFQQLLPTILEKFPNGQAMPLQSIPMAMPVVVDIVTAALQRNYPEMTREMVETELLDLGNAKAALDAALNNSPNVVAMPASPAALTQAEAIKATTIGEIL